MSSNNLLYEPSDIIKKEAHIKKENYKELYEESLNNPDKFWSKIAEDFYWKKKPNNHGVLQYNFDINKGQIYIKAFQDGLTNICYNAIDRHIEKGLGNKIAFYWEGNDPADSNKFSYSYLHSEVCKFANLLRSKELKKGDRVAIYMPMIVELPIAMLACARIGVIHLVIFGGFSAESVAERMADGMCKVLVTSDGCWRGLKFIDLKNIADQAMEICEKRGKPINHCFVVKHVTQNIAGKPGDVPGCRPARNVTINMKSPRDEWWDQAMSQPNLLGDSPVEWVEAEHPLFILHTSGSTGKPKGIVHSTAGYMIYTAMTYKYVFDHKDDDIYWSTADIGWITGHSYVVYGPMSQGVTSVIFEGIPTHPDVGRYWQIVDKYLVTKFYTAPTVIRTLMRCGDEFVKKYKRSSLKVLGTVGEPINPRVWVWYYEVVGNKSCPIVDTYWQTETGGHIITALPGATSLKPGSATLPFFGVHPVLIDDSGKELNGPGEGFLAIKKPWPGMMRTVYQDPKRFEVTYFSRYPGYYVTGDAAVRDENGYFTITGRVDDMLNVSGHLISTAEVESALVSHHMVVEAAVVPIPHEIKGECCYCYVTLAEGFTYDSSLKAKLIEVVRNKIGAFATPEFIQEAPALPKTRSGKIMRRILRKIACNESDFGDTSTLADPSAIDVILKCREKNI